MFIVINPVGGWDDFVALFDTFAKARRWVGTNEKFRIIKCDLNSQEWNYVYIRGVKGYVLEEINIIKSRKYVQTPKNEYSKAIKNILNNASMTMEELARAINKPVQFVEYYFKREDK